MTESVTPLSLVERGDGLELAVNDILEANKDSFIKLVLVGETGNGELKVASSHGTAEATLLLAWGQHFLVSNKVSR